MPQKVQVTENAGAGRILRPIAVSVVLGAVVSVAILLLFSLVVSSGSIPQSAIDPMAILAVGAGAFSAGMFCAKIVGRGGLSRGFLCGALFSVILLICSLAVPDNGLGAGAVLKTALMMISAMLGGVVGVNMRRRKK